MRGVAVNSAATTAEFEVVCSLLRGERQNVPSSLDPERLEEFIGRHGLSNLLTRGAGFYELLPEPYRRRAQAASLLKASASLKLTAELLQLLAALRERGVVGVPFKGAVLSQLAYGDVGARPFTDNDILVERADLGRALECLRGLGYVQKPEGSRARERYVRDTSYKVTLARSPYGPFLDLHWEVALPALGIAPPFSEMKSRLETTKLQGKEIATLGREDLFLALVIHGSRHHWQRLLWIYDLVGLRKNFPPDGPLLRSAAERYRITRMLRRSLEICHHCFGQEAVQHQAGERAVDEYVASTLRLLSRSSGSWASDRSKARFFLAGLDNRWVRLRRAFSLLLRPTPSDFQYFNVPDALFFLYYPLRWGRLAAVSIGSVVRRLGVQPVREGS